MENKLPAEPSLKRLDDNEYLRILSTLNSGNRIGAGNAGIVHRVFYDDEHWAFKYNRIGKYDSLKNELAIYKFLCDDSVCSCHQNIIKLHAYYDSPENKTIALVLDYYVGTELGTILNYPQDPDTHKTHRLMPREDDIRRTDWEQLCGILQIPIEKSHDIIIINLFNEILRGLLCLHGKGILHRDLELKNILVKKGSVVITDFGLSRFCKSFFDGIEQSEKWHIFSRDNSHFGGMLGDFLFADDKIPFQLLIEDSVFPLELMARLPNKMLSSVIFVSLFMPSIFNYISAMYYTIISQDSSILFLDNSQFERILSIELTNSPTLGHIYQFITKIYGVKEINLFQFYVELLKKTYDGPEDEFIYEFEGSVLYEDIEMANALSDHQFLDIFIDIFT
jgi:serine/threonine protein kinase